MEINKLNVSQICHVKSYIGEKCNFYTYREAIKLFGITLKKEGYYWVFSICGDIYTPIEEIEKDGYCIKNRQVYYKPYISISMSDGKVYRKHFESEHELLNFMESPLMDDINWIKL